MYAIEYTEQVTADLLWFKKHEQNTIVDSIEQQLGHEPTIQTRNRKLLRPNVLAIWELRIGDFRVLYDVAIEVRIVAVKRIGEKRGNAFFFRGQTEEV